MNSALKIALIILITFTFAGCRGRKDDKVQKPQVEIGAAGMVRIPAGVFKMGSDAGTELEAPERLVTTEEYWIDKFEYPNILGEMPLVNVTWHQAREKCLEQGKDLPTERQWEKACRGPNGLAYPYGDEYDQQKCYVDYAGESSPIQSGYHRDCISSFGVYDMSGNVWEWTADWYDADYYKDRIYEDPRGPDEGDYKVLRGGAWYSGKVSSRCSVRYVGFPDASKDGSGGRCCK